MDFFFEILRGHCGHDRMVVGFTITYAIGAGQCFSRDTPIMKRNSDGHQFHQYQQNEQSLLILIKLAEHKKRPQHMTLEIQVLAWDRHNNVVGLILLM
jgi:hypothetical protein